MLSGASGKLVALTVAGALSVVVGVLLTLLFIVFILSPSFDWNADYADGAGLFLLMTLGLTGIGLLLLLLAKKQEKVEMKAKDKKFLEYALSSAVIDELEQRREERRQSRSN